MARALKRGDGPAVQTQADESWGDGTLPAPSRVRIGRDDRATRLQGRASGHV